MSLRVGSMGWVSCILLLFLYSPILAGETRMQEITVRDDEFAVVRVINAADRLAKAQELWDALIPVDELPNTDWTHTLDIRSDSIGGRWLYSEEGYIAKLNYRLKPMYKVSDVKSFNEIFLGP